MPVTVSFFVLLPLGTASSDFSSGVTSSSEPGPYVKPSCRSMLMQSSDVYASPLAFLNGLSGVFRLSDSPGAKPGVGPCESLAFVPG